MAQAARRPTGAGQVAGLGAVRGRGRSGAEPDSVVAVDVGGTGLKGARFSLDGAVLERRTLPTPVAQGPGAVLDAVAALADGLTAPTTCAVGIGCPGLLDTGAGVVRYAPNLGLRDAPLVEAVRRRTELPVVLEHDVRAACLAEGWLGAAPGARDLLLVVLGTGIAAGLVVGGVPVVGATGAAGELGHLPVVPGGEPCTCGQRGCLEVYSSAGGLVRRYRAAGGDADVTTAAELAARLPGDALAARLWGEGARALATALVTSTLLLDPSLVVLAGGLSGAGERLSRPVEAALAEGLAWRPPPPVVISPLGGRAGLVGVALRAVDLHGGGSGAWAPAVAAAS